MKQKVQPLHKV